MRSPVLYFFPLVLEVWFNLISDVVNKRSRFSKTLFEKNLKFILSRRSGPVTFVPGFSLLSADVDSIPEIRNSKKDAFMTFGSSCFKIIFALLIEIVIFYIQVFKI